MNEKSKLAVITGATSGIGASFAKKFASQGYDLLITGRRKEKITEFARSLMDSYKVNIDVVIAELANSVELDALISKITERSNVDILVNNAGFGYRGKFINGDSNIYANMINVHVMATMKLSSAVLPKMVTQKSGAIINVASIMGFLPYSGSSVYAAAKAFTNIFSESISKELKNSGIRVQTLCPGLTDTDFFRYMDENVHQMSKTRGWSWIVMPSDRVVEASLKYLKKNKVICIPGITNKLIVATINIMRFFKAWR
jgi:uncharacterized protein